MNAFQRFWNGLFGSLEDPSRQLAVFVDELDRHVRDLHRAVARAIADEKRQKMQIEDHLAKAADWEARAVLALQNGDEALAREALLQKEQCEAHALTLQKSWETQREATQKLKASLRAEKVRVEDAKTKYSLLLAQYQSAATRKRIHDTLSAESPRSPTVVIEELSDRIRQIEAETEVNLEMAGDAADDLDARFMELERRARGDAALEALRQRIGERRQLTDLRAKPARLADLKAKLEE
jgi:phage shock protein A